MPLRPEISLGVKPPEIMNPGQLLTLQNVAQQRQLGQLQIEDTLRARRERDELQSLFKNPDMIDPKTGTISLKGITSAYGIAPEKGAALAKDRQASLKSMAEMAKLDIENKTSQAKYLRDGLAGVTDQASYDAWRQNAASMGFAVETAPPVFDPNWQKAKVLDADKFIAQNTPKFEPVDIGGEITMIDRNPITNPAIRGTNLAKTVTPGERLTDTRSREEGAKNRAVTMRGQDLADARSRDANAATAGKATNEQENKMRDDYTSASKKFVEVRDAHQRVIESAQDPSAAGDMALIFNFMKVLDPGSTVREGEFATAQNAGGVPDRITAMYNRVLSGERLAPDVRNDFLNRSKRLYEGAVVNQEEIEKDYEEKAKRAGARPEQVVTRYRVKEKAPSKPAGPASLTPEEKSELEALRKKYGRG